MKYCIFGDSWSVKSKTKLSNFEEGTGSYTFQKMFAAVGKQANNYSIESSSNEDTIKQINKIDLADTDCVIVFQTDPLRKFVGRKNFNLNTSGVNQKNLVCIAEESLLEFYQLLSNLNKPVLLVGGLSCIAHHLVPNNIHTISKSWTELVKPTFKDCYFEWVEYTELVRDILKCNDDLKEIKEQIQNKNYIWQTSDAFGWCHPSDVGYEIMFAALMQKLNELKL